MGRFKTLILLKSTVFKIEGFETKIFLYVNLIDLNGRFNTTSTNKKLFPNNKNIYSDTSDTMTKKQTFVRLLRQKTRPDR